MYWYYSSSQLEHHQCPASTFPISGNHGKLTALRCPIAVCSLLLYLIQRFIVLCKTLFKGRITVGSEAPSGKYPSIAVSYWKRYARTSTTQTAMLPYRKLMWILFFELPQARPSDIWCSVFTISPPMFQRFKYTLGLDVRVMVPVCLNQWLGFSPNIAGRARTDNSE